MARIVLTFTMIVAAFNFLIPRLSDFFGIVPWRFIGLSMCFPAVILGTRSWWKTRSFARSWPVVACVIIAWVGLLYAGETKSNRGVLIAAYLTMVLPVAALIVENRCWWHCVRVYVIASLAALALVIWFECRTHSGAMHFSLIRFGMLVSEDQSRYMANPNRVGGQLAFAAVLAFMLYLRREAARLRQASTAPRQDAFGLAGVVFLSLGCILTASRGAFVSWFGGMALLLFYGTGRIAPSKVKDLVALFAMALSLALFVWVAGGDMPWGKLYERVAGEESENLGTAGSRTTIWKNAMEAWWSDPAYRLMGTGTGLAGNVLGEFDEGAVIDNYGVWYRNCHSAFVEWILTFGFVGIATGLCLLATMCYRAQALDAREGSFDRRAVLACVVLYSLTAVLYRQPGWMAPGALILALLSDPLPSAGLSHSQPQAAGSKLPPADPQRTHAAGPRRPSHRSLGVLERMKS